MTTVSFSQISCWKTCRQKFFWRYVRNIKPRRYAAYVDLGTLCHTGMEAYLKGRDAALAIENKSTEFYKDLMLEEEYQQIRGMVEVAIDILTYNIPRLTTGHIVEVEKEFDLPIPGTKNRVQGRFDAIIKLAGNLWLAEWKFPKTFRTEQDTQLSTQLALYQWAAIKCGYPVVGVLYGQVLQRMPAIPELNKDGSTSKKEIYTDWETYAATVISRGDDPRRYELDMVPKLQSKEFRRQYWLYRTATQVERYIYELRDVSRDIADPKKRIYTCESATTCSGCHYRDLCLEQSLGRSPEELIEAMFVPYHTEEEKTNVDND